MYFRQQSYICNNLVVNDGQNLIEFVDTESIANKLVYDL